MSGKRVLVTATSGNSMQESNTQGTADPTKLTTRFQHADFGIPDGHASRDIWHMSDPFTAAELDELGSMMAMFAYENAFEGESEPLRRFAEAGLPLPGEEVLFATELLAWTLFVFWGMIGVTHPKGVAEQVQKGMLRRGHEANSAMREHNQVRPLTEHEWTELIKGRFDEYGGLLETRDRDPIKKLCGAVASHLSSSGSIDARVAMPIYVLFVNTLKHVQPMIQEMWQKALKRRVG